MRVALCLSGLETADFTRRALERLPEAVEFCLLYVIDTRPAEELNFVRRSHLFGSRTGSSHQHDLRSADQDLGSRILAEAADLIESDPAGRRQVAVQLIFQGRPEREIINYLDRNPVDLVVIGTRFQGDLQPASPLPPPPKAKSEPLPLLDPLPGRGPQSIPPIARFIIDHALCDILILK
jgi:nucleotide-binding universal stress UspA family protein